LGATQATLDVVREMASAMEEHRRHLTKLDSEIGDGDHGNNMHRGFQAALERLEGADPSSPADALKAVSMALVSKVGGAAGAALRDGLPARLDGAAGQRRGLAG
jgi:dihydroxyacetone kinase-like protein